MTEIPVTQNDIDAGVPDYIKPDGCVIARALRRHFGESVVVLVGSIDVFIGEKAEVALMGRWDTYQFDGALLKYAANIHDAFHEIPHPPILPGVVRLDKQTMTASYEEKAG